MNKEDGNLNDVGWLVRSVFTVVGGEGVLKYCNWGDTGGLKVVGWVLPKELKMVGSSVGLKLEILSAVVVL